MAFQVDGKLHRVFATEQKTETFSAREFILEISESQYPQLIKFQLTQDKCELIDAYQEGQDLTVHFDLRGREWNDKFFTNLNAWKIEPGGQGGGQGGNQGDAQGSNAIGGQAASTKSGNDAQGSKNSDMDFDDDIPF